MTLDTAKASYTISILLIGRKLIKLFFILGPSRIFLQTPDNENHGGTARDVSKDFYIHCL